MMRRLNASTVTQAYAMPVRVGTEVTSVAYRASGRWAVNCRMARSGALAASGWEYRRVAGFPEVLLVPMAPSSSPRPGSSEEPRMVHRPRP